MVLFREEKGVNRECLQGYYRSFLREVESIEIYYIRTFLPCLK